MSAGTDCDGQDFPEDKFSFKPQAESRTFWATLCTLGVMYYFTDTARGRSHATPMMRGRQRKNRRKLVAFVKKCVEDCARRSGKRR